MNAVSPMARDQVSPERASFGEAPPFLIEVHAGLDALATIWPRAGAPSEAVCHVFQTQEFLQVWLRTYGTATRARPFFVAVREHDGRPVLLIPLALTRRRGISVLTFADALACDYNAPVLFPTERAWTAELTTRLWHEIKQALPPFDLALLDKMPAEVDGRVNPLALIASADNPESCHGNDLRRPWAEVEKSVHGVRTLRKCARALGRIAPSRLERADTAESRAEMLAALLALKERRFVETRVPGFDRNPEKRAFFEQATETFAASGSLSLTSLRVGDEIVATLWGIIHAGRYYGLMTGFEAGRWASFSPGRVAYLLQLEALHAQGCSSLDLGIGDEPWKIAQADYTVGLRMHAEPATWRGRFYLRMQHWIAAIRERPTYQRLRPLKWALLRRLRAGGHDRSARQDSGRSQ